jgi:hypothetical protein
MPIGGTTIGPIAPELRDRIAEYRDREGYANYNEALEALINSHEG